MQAMNIGNDLLSLVPKSEAKDLLSDAAEVLLDANLQDGVLKDIPLVGTVLKLGSAAGTIRDRIFLRKVARFLKGTKSLPVAELADFRSELQDASFRKSTGEKLLLILEQQDDFDKAELIGELFARYLGKEIDLDDFQMLSHALTICYLPDLDWLWRFDERQFTLDSEIGAVLMACGLAHLEGRVGEIKRSGDDMQPTRFVLSELGSTLARILKELRANKG